MQIYLQEYTHRLLMPTNFDSFCIGCPYQNGKHLPEVYRRMRATPLSMEDNRGAVLLIFRAPGVEEWRCGKPVSSTKPWSAGRKLETAFGRAGKSRVNYNITNVVQCFPGKQEPNGDKLPRDKKPPKAAFDHCSSWLRQDIEAYNYKRIVVFGSDAYESVSELDYADDHRVYRAPHPTASGISIDRICQDLG